MSEEKLSKFEGVKEQSNFLRGSIGEELLNADPTFSEDNAGLLKFHGTYQQDNRDARGGKPKEYSFMVRSRVPGGKVTPEQFLAHLDICEEFANGTLRVTDRQAFQLHGVLKTDLKSAIRGINESKLSTIAACGDVCRNFMCCPAPQKNNPVHDQMQKLADAMADHFRPKSLAYYEIWLKDGENSELVHQVVDEPIYGKTYLPRKFKMGVTLPEDNCIDVYTQDLGLIAVVEGDTIVGYNMVVGGGMGMTPAKKDTFPAVGKRMTYVTPEQVIPVAEAVVKVQRDFGNRADRKHARMKYLIAEWGLPKFKAKVEEYYGAALPEPHPTDVTNVDDHIGWHEQGDGKLFLGINIENGRLKDEGPLQLKAAFRELLAKFPFPLRLTALQGIILCDVEPKDKPEIESILRKHGVKLAHELTLIRRYSIACPALPTCGLAVTESERVLPAIMDELEATLDQYGLKEDRIAVHMTGCPNGCARPYTPDIGLVGKARGKYTLYLGGNAEGTRLGFIFQDMVPEQGISTILSPIFAQYRDQRQDGESFGDFCHRVGKDSLARAEAVAAT
ncbi:sulfite reductase (ferredoxin) [Planctomicrobium piriforme]|uniref:Sulfite reductase (Ferredoxin) n=2 Tax=Planctomicrobium piriforme TaxID=1576369 RepID=A0A1I3C3L2_9PLAN|nr:sulfite reductase (ferredoxin) [Planctomicrobium piriforme]